MPKKEQKETKVGLKLSHKISPVQYESVEVSLYLDETVKYETEEERASAVDSFVSRSFDDFSRAYGSVLESLKVKDHPVCAVYRTPNFEKVATLPVPSKVDVKVEPKKTLAPSKEDLDDFFDGV
jgi:hypothetical protein